ncbi:DUF4142 domain-containing protein [Dyella jejuensis]|uniref:DUF4142 domain-containing protein n=1 Tax=Dyella jejuensis TaxID=1432009 RepID=A0ABW8JEV9_9GAMM
MRAANFTGLISISLMLALLVLSPAFARAADGQPLESADQAFLMRAMSDNATQIAVAKLALEKSRNPRVIDLANRIIEERTALNTRLTQLLARGSIRVDPKFPASGDATMDKLQSLDGDAFDKTFASTLVRSHCRIISAYEAMKVTSSDLALRAIAHDAIPAFQGNLTIAFAIMRSNDWTSSSRHQEALTAADPHAMKSSVFWEPISLVAAPW